MIKGSNIIEYRLIKVPIDNLEETINYNELKHKYDIKHCSQVCKKELCDDYLAQTIKYDLCKECKKEGKCYNPNKGICEFCLDFRSCDTIYGCNGNTLVNPMNNDCKKCWYN
jgi:hypothetical protein